MIRYLLLLSLLLAGCAAFAQQNMDEVVYLRDGSSVRGLIIELVPGISISIRDKAGQTHTFAMAQVERIRREERPKPPPPPFYAAVELGLTDFPMPHQSTISRNLPLFAITAVAGTKVTPLFYAGLGFGAEVYNTRVYHLSGFAHMRVLLTHKKIAPYLELNTGYNGLVYYDYTRYVYGRTDIRMHTGGGMVQPSLGLKVSVSHSVALTLSAGYKLVAFPKDATGASYMFYSDRNRNLGHAVTVRAGVMF